MRHILSLLGFFLPFVGFAQSTLSSHSTEVKVIIVQDTIGLVRGLTIGSSLADVKARETAQLESEGKDFVIYKLLINPVESAEIIYTLDEQAKVKGITIAFLENINSSVEEQILDDFQRYFTERFGKNHVNDKNEEVWSTHDGLVIEMGDASSGEGDVMEIEIDIYKKKK